MGRGIIALKDKQENVYYLDWSTICDAPVTNGMTRKELIQYLAENRGYKKCRCGCNCAAEAVLAHIDKYGHSWTGLSKPVEDIISHNRAGTGDTSLTIDELIQYYCLSEEDTEG